MNASLWHPPKFCQFKKDKKNTPNINVVDSYPTKDAALAEHISISQTNQDWRFSSCTCDIPDLNPLQSGAYACFFFFKNLNKTPLIGCNESAS